MNVQPLDLSKATINDDSNNNNNNNNIEKSSSDEKRSRTFSLSPKSPKAVPQTQKSSPRQRSGTGLSPRLKKILPHSRMEKSKAVEVESYYLQYDKVTHYCHLDYSIVAFTKIKSLAHKERRSTKKTGGFDRDQVFGEIFHFDSETFGMVQGQKSVRKQNTTWGCAYEECY